MGYVRILSYTVIILVVVYKLLRKYYLSGGKCPKKLKKPLRNSTVVITGGSSGIGFAAAREYLKLQAKKIIILNRSEKRGEEAVKKLKLVRGSKTTKIEFIPLDLSDFDSIESVAKKLEEEEALDILILNAACLTPGKRKQSKHDIELMFAVGFVGHFYLVQLLLEKLTEDRTRVIATTGGQNMMPMKFPEMDDVFSNMEKTGLLEVFGLAKTCMMLFIKALDKHFREEDSFSSAYHLHPGVTESGMGTGGQDDVPLYFKLLKTFLMGPMGKLFGKTEEEIVQSHLFLTFAPQSELVGGGYYVDCKLVKDMEFFEKMENVEKAWALGEEIVKRVKESRE